jgi:hypothetical protein
MIASILWYALATGSLLTGTSSQYQDIINNYSWIEFVDFLSWDCSEVSGWVAAHNYKPLGGAIKSLGINDKVDYRGCQYIVKNRLVVEREKVWYSDFLKSWTVILQTCRTNDAKYILILTLQHVN